MKTRTRIEVTIIYTSDGGRPFERPEKPAAGACIEEKVAWIHAMHAYNTAIANSANASFAKAFSKAMRG